MMPLTRAWTVDCAQRSRPLPRRPTAPACPHRSPAGSPVTGDVSVLRRQPSSSLWWWAGLPPPAFHRWAGLGGRTGCLPPLPPPRRRRTRGTRRVRTDLPCAPIQPPFPHRAPQVPVSPLWRPAATAVLGRRQATASAPTGSAPGARVRRRADRARCPVTTKPTRCRAAAVGSSSSTGGGGCPSCRRRLRCPPSMSGCGSLPAGPSGG
jgi:hypothetical protein